MQRLTQQIQKVSSYLVVILIVLTGLKFVLTLFRQGQAYSNLSESADQAFQDRTPEQLFSQLDGVTDSGTVQTYTILLDRLDSKCFDRRNEVALMVYSLNRLNREAGYSESYLDTLSVYTEAAESGFEHTGECIEVYQHLKP